MIYIIVLVLSVIILLYFTLCNSSKSTNKKMSNVFAVIMFIFSIIRYGSGPDYFGYQFHYIICPPNFFDAVTSYDKHLEIGYKLIICLFRFLGLEFEIFVAVLSAFMLSCCFISIYRLSNNIFLSLFMFYTVYYQVYINSALRQGIAISLMLLAISIILKDDNFYDKNKMKKWLCISAIACLFHTSAVITFVLIIIYKYSKKICANIDLLIIIAVLVSGLSYTGIFSKVIYSLFSIVGLSDNIGEPEFSIMSIGLRSFNLIVVTVLYKINKNKLDDKEKYLMSIYVIGVILYFGVCGFSLLSRLTEYFAIFEIILIPNLIRKTKFVDIKILATVFLIAVCSLLCVKDLKSFLLQGDFYLTKVTQYPFVTIFNERDIASYRLNKYSEYITYKSFKSIIS